MQINTTSVALVPRPFYRTLYFQVIFAIILGALIGHFWPSVGESLKPLGDGFIKLVKMIIAPVIFLTIVTGLAGMTSLRGVGSVAAKAFGYFFVFSTLALVVGLIVANVVQPGAGMNIDPSTLDASAVQGYSEKAHETTVSGFRPKHHPGHHGFCLCRWQHPASAVCRHSVRAWRDPDR